MSGVIPPWPPADAALPLEYSRRGCCWPMGPCTPHQYLPERIAVEVYRQDAAPISPLYTVWQGQTFLIDGPNSNRWLGYYLGNPQLNPLASNRLRVESFDSGETWHLTAAGGINDNPAWSMLIGMDFVSGTCTGVHVTTNIFPIGPNLPPDRARIYIVRWWEIAPYPYYG